ncbi:MAG: tetratricopeptide repeat protein [Candidatus Eisenbacteria bacterium]
MAESVPTGNRWLVRGGFLVGAAFLFGVFRMRAHLLGDGQLLPNAIDEGRWWMGYESLDFMIHVAFARFLGLFGVAKAVWSYVTLSIVAGVLFVPAAYVYSRAVSQSPQERTLTLVVLLTLGTSQAFFGHVESYGLCFPMILLYFWSCHRALLGQGKWTLPVVFYVVLLLLHITFAAFGLSLVFLLFQVARRRRLGTRAAVLGSAGVVGGMTAAVLLAVLWITNRNAPADVQNRAAMAILQPWPQAGMNRDLLPYAVLSRTHLTNLANQVLLVASGVFALLVALVAGKRWVPRKDPGREKERTFLFCLLATWPFQAFGFLIFKPQYAGFGDWDLLSLPAIPFALFVIRLAASSAPPSTLPAVAVVVSGVQLLVLIPRVAVNSVPELAAERYMYMVREYRESWDVVSLRMAYRRLSEYYEEHGNPYEATETAFEGLRASLWNPRLYCEELRRAEERGERLIDEKHAIESYQSAVRRALPSVGDDEGRAFLLKEAGQFLFQKGYLSDAVWYLDSLSRLDVIEYDAPILSGMAHARMGRLEEARARVEEGLSRIPPGEERKRAAAHVMLSWIQEQMGQPEAAERSLEHALDLDPHSREALAGLRASESRPQAQD